MKIIKIFMKIVHTKYIFFISRAKTRRRAGVPWAMLEPNKIFAVPYRHGRCASRVHDPRWHEAVPARPGPTSMLDDQIKRRRLFHRLTRYYTYIQQQQKVCAREATS